MLKRPTPNDGKMAEVGTAVIRVFNMLNDPPPECKNTRFLEVALIKKYGMFYCQNFKYISSNNVVNKSVTFKFIVKVVQNVYNSLPCFS